MVVIPNGIDTEIFKPDAGSGTRIRAEWGIKEDEKVIGLVARLDPMKDHPTFLEAAAILVKERKDVRFVCVGDGPDLYKSRLRELSCKYGLETKLIWTGTRSDMPFVYNTLDIATSSSSYGEGFPNVIGEAMACGVPCVVTDVGDSGWIVGDTGIVLAPKSPGSIVMGWNSLLSLDLTKMMSLKEKVRRRVIENMSVQKMVYNTEQLLAE